MDEQTLHVTVSTTTTLQIKLISISLLLYLKKTKIIWRHIAAVTVS
jgi:hypothetical protein